MEKSNPFSTPTKADDEKPKKSPQSKDSNDLNRKTLGNSNNIIS